MHRVRVNLNSYPKHIAVLVKYFDECEGTIMQQINQCHLKNENDHAAKLALNVISTAKEFCMQTKKDEG